MVVIAGAGAIEVVEVLTAGWVVVVCVRVVGVVPRVVVGLEGTIV